jgi:hypothetical protein
VIVAVDVRLGDFVGDTDAVTVTDALILAD